MNGTATMPALSRFSRFLGLRLRRVLGYAIIGGLSALAIALLFLAGPINALADTLVLIWRSPPPGGSFQPMVLSALPIVLTLLTAVGIGAAAVGVLGAVLAAILPRAFLPMVDGALGGFLLIGLLEATGANKALLAMGLPGIAPLLLFYIVAAPLTSFLWNRLPFGLGLSDTASAELPLSPEAATEALLAYFGVTGLGPGETGDGASPIKATTIQLHRADDLLFDVRQRPTNPKAAAFRHAIRLEPLAGGGSALHLESSVAGISPIVWWTLWSRPFARDYAEHVRAAIVGEDDPSVNGRILRRLQRRGKRWLTI